MARPKRVLAVASGGGHWMQLRRLRPAWDGCAVTYVTTRAGYGEEVAGDALDGQDGPPPRFFVVPDANRWQKLRLVRQLLAIAWVVFRSWPDAVVTTGAAPGYFAVRLGRLLGARTIWIDSIANAEELSLSGQRAGRHVDLWLTQWEHLAADGTGRDGRPGPRYCGSVL